MSTSLLMEVVEAGRVFYKLGEKSFQATTLQVLLQQKDEYLPAFKSFCQKNSQWSDCPLSWFCAGITTPQVERKKTSKSCWLCQVPKKKLHEDEAFLNWAKSFNGNGRSIESVMGKEILIFDAKQIKMPQTICVIEAKPDGTILKITPQINWPKINQIVISDNSSVEQSEDEVTRDSAVIAVQKNTSQPLVFQKKVIDTCEQLRDVLPGESVLMNLSIIRFNTDQPRRHIKPEDVDKKGKSIKMKGDVEEEIQVTIRFDEAGAPYPLLVSGELRTRGGLKYQVTHLSTKIREEMDDKQLFKDSAVANCNRTNMSPIDEAEAIARIMRENNVTQEDVGVLFSKSPGTISNILKYLNLEPEFQEYLIRGKISKGEALAIQRVKPALQKEFHQFMIKEIEEGGGKVDSRNADKYIQNFLKTKKPSEPVLRAKSRSDRLNSVEKIITATLRHFEQLQTDLAEIKALKGGDFRTCSKTNPVLVLEKLEEMIPVMEELKNRLDKMVG
jgi:ParB/RepB/Spo0J family partition protein